MGSSEIVDSGRFSGGRSNFSQTCSLLSQYLKRNGSFGDLTLGLTHNLESKGALTETMNFLPMIEKSDPGSGPLKTTPFPLPHQAPASDETQKKSAADTAQMTIFYAGQVVVFDDFPADKAKEIMMLASKSASSAARIHHTSAAFAPPHTAQSQAESATSVPAVVPTFGIQEAPLDSDLPIARKNSLARFLEKRRDRITANAAPYSRNKPAAAAAANAEAWLGLAPHHLPVQIQRH